MKIKIVLPPKYFYFIYENDVVNFLWLLKRFRFLSKKFRMAKMNLKELAGKPGVSLSTVSEALRNSYEIGEETKRKY